MIETIAAWMPNIDPPEPGSTEEFSAAFLTAFGVVFAGIGFVMLLVKIPRSDPHYTALKAVGHIAGVGGLLVTLAGASYGLGALFTLACGGLAVGAVIATYSASRGFLMLSSWLEARRGSG